jgi:Leucine-rich repeat (LRR) protein
MNMLQMYNNNADKFDYFTLEYSKEEIIFVSQDHNYYITGIKNECDFKYNIRSFPVGFQIEHDIEKLYIDFTEKFPFIKCLNFSYLRPKDRNIKLSNTIFPQNIECLICRETNINKIEFDSNLPVQLKIIVCSKNCIKCLDNLPNSIIKIDCSQNQIESLDNLPQELEWLDCSNNKIESLDNLSIKLKSLNCSNNKIISLDNLPFNLKSLNCSDSFIISLDNLPHGLINLTCTNCELLSLDNLPDSLEYIVCTGNIITNLDNLPSGLKSLSCQYNKISQLNCLPHKLTELYCSNNFMKTIILPQKIEMLNISNNSITEEFLFQEFTQSLKYINWRSNPILEKFINDNSIQLNCTGNKLPELNKIVDLIKQNKINIEN